MVVASAHPPRSGMGVVVNPHSRRNRRRRDLVGRLSRAVGDRGVVVRSNDREHLLRIAEDFRRQRIDLLALSGGDGTVGFTLTAFAEVYGEQPLPKLALLRAGTMNTIANSVGLPRRGPAAHLRSLSRRHARGEPLGSSRRVTLRIVHGGEVRLGFLFGTGVARGFLEEYYARSSNPTVLTAARVLARIAWSSLSRGELARRLAERERLVIEAGDERWPERGYIGVMAGTVAQVGLGFSPFHRTAEGLARFHLIGIHAPPARVAMRIYRIRLARSLGGDCAQEELLERALLSPARGHLSYFLDGDLYRAEGDVAMDLGPRVRFVW